MKPSIDLLTHGGRQHYVMAMVLGTALTAALVPTARASSPEVAEDTLGDLGRYCTACWRNAHLPPDDWTDCTQEVFLRLLERVPSGDWHRALTADGAERREFIRAIDTVKKRVQRRHKWTSYPADAVADDQAAQADCRARARADVSRTAGVILSDRQQRILQLSFEGWSVQEIGDELRLPPERVSDEKYKAIRKLRQHLGSEV